jgi:hypothetical protein
MGAGASPARPAQQHDRGGAAVDMMEKARTRITFFLHYFATIRFLNRKYIYFWTSFREPSIRSRNARHTNK